MYTEVVRSRDQAGRQPVGLMLLVVVVMTGILLAVAASAARVWSRPWPSGARVAAAMMSAEVLTAVVIVTAVTLWARH